ncbi:MAG: hypothetical protein U7126_01060 [Microcoleus sp.]
MATPGCKLVNDLLSFGEHLCDRTLSETTQFAISQQHNFSVPLNISLQCADSIKTFHKF